MIGIERVFSYNTAFLSAHPTGSRYICGKSSTDSDWVVLAKADYEDCFRRNVEADGGEDYDIDQFQSFRGCGGNSELNLIITTQFEFYSRFVKATMLARQLGLKRKTDRIALFDFIMDECKP